MTEDIYKYRGIKANFHTHTSRCMHASGEDREYVEAAIKAGFKVLGFSDHVPYPFRDGHRSRMRMSPKETEGYVNSVLSLRNEYKEDIKILLGFEAEYFPEEFDALLKHLEEYPVDYMILGQHYLDNEDMNKETGMKREDEAFLLRYINQVIEGVKTGYFSYIAHPDVINYSGDEKIYEKHIRNFAEQLKQLRIPVEVNQLGYSRHSHYPSKRFFHIASEVGNDCVLGVDAHAPKSLLDTDNYNACLKFAKDCGLSVLNAI